MYIPAPTTYHLPLTTYHLRFATIYNPHYPFTCRFGEESLHSCEVMLKDVEDSKRANNGVHGELARAKKVIYVVRCLCRVPVYRVYHIRSVVI